MVSSENKISVVIPLYNKRAHIVDTLRTVLNQTRPADEIVIVDDGSTDDGATLVEDFIQSHGNNSIRLIKQKNGGVSRARNRGTEEATGDFIALLDADDGWAPEFLMEIESLMVQFPKAGAYATNYYQVIKEGVQVAAKVRFPNSVTDSRLLHDYFLICSKGDLPFMTSSICIRKETLLNIGGFPEGEPMGEDQDVWAKLTLESSIAYSFKRLLNYHLDAMNRACNIHSPKVECPFSQRLHLAVKAKSVPKELEQDILRYTATHLLHLARMRIDVGDIKSAEQLLSDGRCNLLPLKKARQTIRVKLLWLSSVLGISGSGVKSA